MVVKMKNNFSATIFGLVTAAIMPNIAMANGHNVPDGLPSGPPPMAKPGQCFARVLVPAVYKNIPMEVVTQDGYQNFETRDPVFRSRPETIVTRDGYTRYITTEPVFRTEQVTKTTRPEYERLVASPAQLATKTETVVIREPRMVWRSGQNLSGVRRLDAGTGEVYCLVEERGVTQTIARQVVVRPSDVKRVIVPAEVKTFNTQVLVQPATVKEVKVAPEVATYEVKEIVQPAMERKVAVPEQRSTVNRQKVVTPEHYEWVQVDCDQTVKQPPMPIGRPATAPMSEMDVRGGQINVPAPAVKVAPEALRGRSAAYSVTSLQTALAKRGFYRGPIDGIYGPLTRDAVARFQKTQGFEVNGRADGKIADALGL